MTCKSTFLTQKCSVRSWRYGRSTCEQEIKLRQGSTVKGKRHGNKGCNQAEPGRRGRAHQRRNLQRIREKRRRHGDSGRKLLPKTHSLEIMLSCVEEKPFGETKMRAAWRSIRKRASAENGRSAGPQATLAQLVRDQQALTTCSKDGQALLDQYHDQQALVVSVQSARPAQSAQSVLT